MEMIWKMKASNQEMIEKLAAELDVPKLVTGVLVNRGISNLDEARKFLYPEQLQTFYNPFLLKDMECAVNYIKKAIEERKKIIIYGDYDVDGISSVAVLYRTLFSLGAAVGYYIPDRHTEGYGFNEIALERIVNEGYDLLISVDCGISSIKEIEKFSKVIDIIVTDHHLPLEELPKAKAVVNPHRKDCTYPNDDLAGVGVAFKLCQALKIKMEKGNLDDDIELVALGTIADVVSLLGENRRIVKQGLKALNTTRNLGIKALLEISGVDLKKITADTVAYVIAPRLNAAGRLQSALIGVELLLTENEEEARKIAQNLNLANKERQEIEMSIFKEVEASLDESVIKKSHVIVVAGENWHDGVIGIVASRLVEKYYLPSVVINIKDGIGKGSCRSTRGLSIYEALNTVKDKLIRFGGHPMAAGLSLNANDIDSFRSELEEYATKTMKAEDFYPELFIDYEVEFNEVTKEAIDALELLEPYGQNNPKPVFVMRDIRAARVKKIGKEQKHLSFLLADSRENLRVVGWNMAHFANMAEKNDLNIAFFPELNEWQGRVNLQYKLIDMKCEKNKIISRSVLGHIYLYLKSMLDGAGCLGEDVENLATTCCVSVDEMHMALTIFSELGLVFMNKGKRYFKAPPKGKKLDLLSSPTFSSQKHENTV